MHHVSHKEAHRALLSAGYALVKKSGKGSHKKYKRAGTKVIILSTHCKNIDIRAYKELAKAGIL